jgi:iron complex outermembrane receptor protein
VITYYGQNTRAFAAFAEATTEPFQHLFLTGGIRYNNDHKKGFNTAGATGVTNGTDRTWSNVSPRGVVRYEFNDSSNVYFSYTKGFKSGTYNAVTVTGSILPADPETIDAYEGGVKATIIPGVFLNAAVFHYNYKDLQVSTPVLVNGVSATTVQNAGEAHIDGIELALEARVTPQFHLNASANLMKTKMLDFPDASVNIPRTTNGVVTNTGNLSVVQDVSGNQLIRSPKRTFTLGATYTVPLGESQLIFNTSAFFSSKYYLDLTNRVHQPAYEVVSGSITWRMHPQGGFYGTVFVQNLTNQAYLAGEITTAFGDSAQANKPRWFGATVGFDF